jgi:hypothetical protein
MTSEHHTPGEERRSRIAVFGTPEPPPIPARLVAGPLSVELINGVVRGVRWHGVEVIRAIDCPIRDENWLTHSPRSPEERLETNDDGFTFERHFAIFGRALFCRLVFSGRADGLFRASAELTADSDFRTNRAGFALLHPIAGVAGSPVTVFGTDGSERLAEFPQMISARQPVLDITGLLYSVHGIKVGVTFTGETFEMEDQRNWTDASFKTYCRPLSRPVPYVIPAGETVRQEIEIRLSGTAVQDSDPATDIASARLQPNETTERVPVVALALDAASLPNADENSLATLVRPRTLQLRVTPETLERVLSGARALMGLDDPEIDLAITIPTDQQIDECLEKIADACSRSSIDPAHVIALPEAYLRSYQPDGVWPEGPTPRDAAVAARRWFPRAEIGGGVLTNFTEVNRCRPDMSVCDYLTHGTTAIVHSADDRSVVETLEGLSEVFTSARELGRHRGYRLGLVSIGMQSNPYGPGLVANPEQIRLAMTEADPRQRGLFAAAWAVGAVAATKQHGVASMALAAPVGPFGIVYRRAGWPQPIYDDRSGAVVYPLFHVVRALSQVADAPRWSICGVPRGVVGVAAKTDFGIRLFLANVSGESRHVVLPREASVRRLDEDTFEDAISDQDWLEDCEVERCSDVALGGFSVAFVDLPGFEVEPRSPATSIGSPGAA